MLAPLNVEKGLAPLQETGNPASNPNANDEAPSSVSKSDASRIAQQQQKGSSLSFSSSGGGSSAGSGKGAGGKKRKILVEDDGDAGDILPSKGRQTAKSGKVKKKAKKGGTLLSFGDGNE